MIRHETCKMQINGELADIDKGIVPLIEKLNSIKGVTTLHCCQGEYATNKNTLHPGGKPYVHFTCETLDNLQEVLSLFSVAPRFSGMQVTVGTFYPDGVLSFSYTFDNRQRLDKIMKHIEKE